MLDIRDHGGSFGGGKGLSNLKTLISVYVQSIQPSGTINKGDVWIKTSNPISKVHIREFLSSPANPQENDLWIKIYDVKLKFLMSKNFQVFSDKMELNVDYTTEKLIGDETVNKFNVLGNDALQIYASLGTARLYIGGKWVYQDAYFYDGTTWKILTKAETDIFLINGYTVTKYSPTLQQLWSFTVPYSSGGMSVEVDSQGNVFVYPTSNNLSNTHYPLYKLDQNGNVLLTKTFDSTEMGPYQNIKKLVPLPNGNFVIRRYDSNNIGNILSMLYDSNGNFIRYNTLTGAGTGNALICADYIGRIYEFYNGRFYVFDQDYTTALFSFSDYSTTIDDELDLTFDDKVIIVNNLSSSFGKRGYMYDFNNFTSAGMVIVNDSDSSMEQLTTFNESAFLLHWGNGTTTSSTTTSKFLKADFSGNVLWYFTLTHHGKPKTYIDKDNFIYIMDVNGTSSTLNKYDKNGNLVFSNVVSGNSMLIHQSRRLTNRPYWL